MKTWKTLMTATVVAAVASLAAPYAAAQPQPQSQSQTPPPGGGGPGGAPGDRPGRMNWDPEQFRQRMMERVREQLEITNDAEWKAIEPLINKVLETRRDSMMAGFGGMLRSFGRGGGGGFGGGPGGAGGFGAMLGEPNPELESLGKAIDSKAGKDELKSAIAKVRDARQAREQKVKQAQEDLRKVLTLRQEAIAIMNGWLD